MLGSHLCAGVNRAAMRLCDTQEIGHMGENGVVSRLKQGRFASGNLAIQVVQASFCRGHTSHLTAYHCIPDHADG